MRARYFKFKTAKLVYKSWWYLSAIFCDVFGRIELYGYENVPKCPCIIVANMSAISTLWRWRFFTRLNCAPLRATPS